MALNKKLISVVKIPSCDNSDSFKTKHRYADSKYRQNVQYLYQLLKEDANEHLTKDILLKSVSCELIKLQNSIIFASGSEKLKQCDDKFLELFENGENIWRKEKDPSQWWAQVHHILKNWMTMENKDSSSFLDVPLSSVIEVCSLYENGSDSAAS